MSNSAKVAGKKGQAFDPSQIVDIQNQREILQGQVVKIQGKINSLIYSAKRCEAALQSMEDLEPGARTYKQVARMFVLKPPSAIREDLQKEIEESTSELPKIVDIKDQLATKLSGIEEQLLEIQKAMRSRQGSGT